MLFIVISYVLAILFVVGFEYSLKKTELPTKQKAYLRMWFTLVLGLAIIWIGMAYLQA